LTIILENIGTMNAMLDLFDTQIKDKRLKSPIAIASMAGITHAE
jgi:hypothetical protein